MKRPRLHGRVTSALAATCFALCASVALAQGKSDAGDDDAPETFVQRACESIGCTDGNRQCGSVSWSTWVWIYTGFYSIPIPWHFTETDTCYEAGLLK